MTLTINDTDIECCDKFSLYKPLKSSGTAHLIVGIVVKTYHDHDKVVIKPEYNPVRYKLLSQRFSGVNEWLCLYGVNLEVTKNIKHIHHILSTSTSPTIEMYTDILMSHGFTCDDNYLLMRKNLICIDNKHLDLLTDSMKLNSHEKLQQMLDHNDKYPWYVNWCDIKIFFII